MMCTLYTWQYIFFQRSTRFRHFSFRVTVRLWTWTDIAWSSFAAFSLHLSPLPFLPSRSEESCFCLFIRKPRLLSESKHQKGQLRLPLSDSRRLREAPLSQTPKNSVKRRPSPRNDLVVSNKLFQRPFIPLLWILFEQTGYPIKFFTYKWKSTDFPFLSYFFRKWKSNVVIEDRLDLKKWVGHQWVKVGRAIRAPDGAT